MTFGHAATLKPYHGSCMPCNLYPTGSSIVQRLLIAVFGSASKQAMCGGVMCSTSLGPFIRLHFNEVRLYTDRRTELQPSYTKNARLITEKVILIRIRRQNILWAFVDEGRLLGP